MIEVLLTAITMRFGVEPVMAMTNQRLDMRSNRTQGSATMEPPRTLLKNVLRLVLSPSATPVFVKTLIRPFAMATIWVGPTSALVSGGTNPD